METTFQRSLNDIEKVLSQRSLLLRSPRSLESGFHMIATIAVIAVIAELFFSAIIWKPGLRKCKVTFMTNILLSNEHVVQQQQ